jgi:hypothetical protein
MNRKDIFNEINRERDYQDGKWGTAFDDKNTINDWVTYINNYATKAAAMGNSKAEQRLQLEKVAALAVAALETSYRNDGFVPRHYDKE